MISFTLSAAASALRAAADSSLFSSTRIAFIAATSSPKSSHTVTMRGIDRCTDASPLNMARP